MTVVLKKRIGVITLSLFSFLFFFSSVWAADFKLRLGQVYVSDRAGVLDVKETNSLKNQIIDLEKKTSAELGILIIKELGDSKSLEEFSVEMARE
jgi:uncharacterized membrane protein YgcG